TTPAQWFDVEIYRLGWYHGGAEAAELAGGVDRLPGIRQREPEVDGETGLVSAAGWQQNAALAISHFRSGLYLLKLVASDGDQNYIPLVVRDDQPHDFALVHAAATDQAYNAWGGKSLYDFNSSGAATTGGSVGAVKVAFDRPFDGDGSGASLLKWELN